MSLWGVAGEVRSVALQSVGLTVEVRGVERQG